MEDQTDVPSFSIHFTFQPLQFQHIPPPGSATRPAFRLENEGQLFCPLHPDIANFISEILNVSEDQPHQFISLLHSVGVWPWPRTDLQYWIKPLNKLDAVLEGILIKYAFGEGGVVEEKKEGNADGEEEVKKDKKFLASNTQFQSIPFETKDKELVLEICRFHRVLFENSMNRKIWSGYDRLDDLFLSNDLDVVVSALLTALRPAHQYSASLHHHSSHFHLNPKTLLSLAQAWPKRTLGVDLSTLVTEENLEFGVHFQGVGELEWDAGKFERKIQKGGDTEMTIEEAHASQGGIQRIKVVDGEKMEDTVVSISKDYDVPIDSRFNLLMKLRIAKAIHSQDASTRRKLLEIKLLAIGTWCHLCSVDGNVAQAKIFTHEPELIAQLADLIHPDKKTVPVEVKTSAFYAMEGLIRFKNKASEVASAVNASLSHGILMCVVKDLVEDLAGEGREVKMYPQEFVEALFGFLNIFQQTANVGGMIINAGIVQLLVQLMKNSNRQAIVPVLKSVSLLDQLLYQYTNAFTIFSGSGGLQVYVDRIKATVDLVTGEDMKRQLLASKHFDSPQGPLPADLLTYLKAFFRSLHRIMTQSGTTESLRNLIDSSLTESIKSIMQNSKLFGPQVYALAVNVMCTFIHNEPTSLTVIQDAGLPEVFYDSVKEHIPPVIDVLSAIPHAIGALCLNEAGLKQFNEQSVISQIFAVFSSEKHIRVLHERDNGSLLGASFDELIRHHPTLKEPVFGAITTLIQDIEKQGRTAVPPETDGYRLHVVKGNASASETTEATANANLMETVEIQASNVSTAGPTTTEEDKKEEKDERRNYITDYINMASRLLEGIFQNVGHCKDFVNDSNLQLLIGFTSLPVIPYDWQTTESYKAYSSLMKTICEVCPTQVLGALLRSLTTTLDNLNDWLDGARTTESRVNKYLDPTPENIDSINQEFRTLITIQGQLSLLSDCNPVIGGYQHGRPLTTVLEFLNGEEEVVALKKLTELHQTCLWENIVIKNAVPAGWDDYNNRSTIRGAQLSSLPAQFTEYLKTEKAEVNKEDPRYKNFKSVRHPIHAAASSLLHFFQGISRMFVHRRSNDSTHRKHAFKAAENMGNIMRDYIKWPGSGDLAADFAYSTGLIRFVSVLLVDDMHAGGLQTLLLLAFDRCGGITSIFDLYQRYQSRADQTTEQVTTQASGSDAPTIQMDLVHVYTGLKAALNLFQTFTSMKPLMESVQTQILSGREPAPGEPVWKSADFLVHLRLLVAPLIQSTWNSVWLAESPSANLTRTTVRIILNILKADGETAIAGLHTTGSIASTLTSQGVFADFTVRATPTADEAKLASLTEMGFPRSIAETALIRCNNNLSAATEWLLNHQGAVAEARSQEARAAANIARGAPNPAAIEEEPEAPSADPVPSTSEGPIPNDPASEPTNDEAPEVHSGDVEMNDSADLEPPHFPEPPAHPVSPPLADLPSLDTDTTMEGSKESRAETAPKPEEKKEDISLREREELENARKTLQSSFFDKALKFAHRFDDLVFDIRDSLSYMKDADEYFSRVVRDLVPDAPSPLDEAATAVKLRLIAVLASDQMYQYMVKVEMSAIAAACKNLLQRFNTDPSLTCRWLAPLLLVTEFILTLADQPKPYDPLKEKEAIYDADKLLVGPKLEAQKEAGFQACMKILAFPPNSKHLVLAVLRLLLCLTKEHTFTSRFIEQNGLSLLFTLFSTDEKSTEGYRPMLLLIIRHVIEDPRLLSSIMERESIQWITSARNNPEPDVVTFTRGTSAMAIREPVAYVKVMQKALELCETQSEAAGTYHVRLLPGNKTKGEKSNVVDQPTLRHNAPDPFAEPTSEMNSTICFLIQQFLDLRANAIVNIPPTTLKDNQTTDNDNEISITPYIHACFLLSCICELIACYPPAKTSLMNYSNADSCKGKHGFVTFLLQDVICPGSLGSDNDNLMSQQAHGLAYWGNLLIVSLMWDPYPASKDRESSSDLIQIRKSVLDLIVKAFKDVPSMLESQERRYSRLAALGDLCNRILTLTPYSTGKKPTESTSLPVAKLMLEKNFVSVLTNAVSDVDLNFPFVLVMITLLLRPIETLTRVVTKVGRSVDRKLQFPVSDELSDDSEGLSEEEEDAMIEDEDTPDFYRNSALGMHDGELDDQDVYMDGNDFDDEDEDMMDGEEDEYMGSDMSDVSDEETEGDAIMNEDDHGESREGTEEDENSDDDNESDEATTDEEVVIEEDIIAEDGEDGDDGDHDHDGLEWIAENVVDAVRGELLVEDPNGEQAVDDTPGGAGVLVDPEDGEDAGSIGSDPEEGEEEDLIDGDEEERPLDDPNQIFAEGFREIIADIGGQLGVREPLRRRLFVPDDRDGTTIGRQRTTQADLSQHPLLVDASLVSPNMGVRTHRRRPMDDFLQNFYDQFNVSSMNALLTHIISHRGDATVQRTIDLTNSRPPAVVNGQTGALKLSARIKSTQEFVPQATSSRWNEESHVYPTVLSPGERASRLSSQVVSALLAKEKELYGPSGRPKKQDITTQLEDTSAHSNNKTLEQPSGDGIRGDVEMAVDELALDPSTRITRPATPQTTESSTLSPQSETHQNVSPSSAQDPLTQIMNLARTFAADNTALPVTDNSFNINSMVRSLSEGVSGASGHTHATVPEANDLEDRQVSIRDESNQDEPNVRDLSMESVMEENDQRTSPPDVNTSNDRTTDVDEVPQNSTPETGTSNAAEVEHTDLAQRVTITIHGTVHDITDTGIDPTFLEALPDDMREEVLNQHIRETRATAAIAGINSSISSDFLDALPPEIRAEVLQQEAIEQGRRNRSANPPPSGAATGPMEIDAGTFIASLDPTLRRQVLLEQEESFLSSLPPQILAEANRLRERPAARRFLPIGHRTITMGSAEASSKKLTPTREAVQLLDKSGVISLVLLLFHTTLPKKNLLGKVLINLAENSKTRFELLGTLLTIFHDGTKDGTAVDKTFSHMSIRAAKGTNSSIKTPVKKAADGYALALPDANPTLIAQRCLDVMTQLVNANAMAPLFFLTEQDTPSGLNRKVTRKGKGKEKALPATTYPLVFLLGMLDRPELFKTQVVVESLAVLLVAITKPLNVLAKKEEGSKKATTDNHAAGEAEMPTTTATNEASSESKEKEKGEAKEGDVKPDDPTQILVSRPPQIPSHLLRHVVNVLDGGECSSKTFQQTLLLIQNLSLLPDGRETILSELQIRAQNLGDQIVEDLELLLKVLKKEAAGSSDDRETETVRSVTLTKFSPATSLQTKLLRILKTIDYVSTAPANGRKPPSEHLQLLSALTSVNDEGESKDGGILTKEQKLVEEIYEKFTFDRLWGLMSQCLGEIEKRDQVEMVQIATVLMPLVEAFMVVCKYSIVNGSGRRAEGRAGWS